jgi:hypothetical protein
MTLNKVVFPAPFGPMMEEISPSGILKETPFKTALRPKLL